MKTFRLIPLLILFLIIGILKTEAQEKVLQKMVDKIKVCKTISYHALSKSNSLFSDEKFTSDVKASYARKNDTSESLLYNIYSDTRSTDNFTSQNNDIYNGKNLLLLVYTDKSYRIKKNYHEPYYADYSIYSLADDIRKYNRSEDYITTMLKDTMINHTLCYHVQIKTKDSIVLKTNSYIYTGLLINKKTYLPVYWKVDQQGVAEKGGMKIGTIKMRSETFADSYRLNAVTPGTFALKIPAGFQEEKPRLPLLEKGTPAPNWSLTATDGKTMSMSSLKGKVTLLDITAIDCPACVLSVLPLNKLHEKYKESNVAIVSINLGDTRDAIVKFKEKNHVNYQVYFNGNSIKPAYHISAIPVFYIIDKKGVISGAFEGFSEDFEQKMISNIEALR